MNKCRRCNVTILDNTQICPLCNLTLGDSEQAEETDSMYPDIKDKTRLVQRISRIAMYMALIMELLLLLINYCTYEEAPVKWSIITGGAILYLIFTMRDLVNKRTGHIQKIYLQMIGAIVLIICIDYALGFSGWSLETGLPCVIFCINLIIVVCMILNSKNWQNYLILQLFTVLLSVIDLFMYLMGIVSSMVLTLVALSISILFWTGTLILGDKKAANELKRKFHI